MSSPELVQNLVKYMKENRDETISQKCKKLGMTPTTYYNICRRHGIEGKIGQRKGMRYNRKMSDVLSSFDEDLSIVKCNPSQNDRI